VSEKVVLAYRLKRKRGNKLYKIKHKRYKIIITIII
jgi:hypothetical protein